MNAVAITIIVCALPEGVPLVITLVLMQNTEKLLKVNVLACIVAVGIASKSGCIFSEKQKFLSTPSKLRFL